MTEFDFALSAPSAQSRAIREAREDRARFFLAAAASLLRLGRVRRQNRLPARAHAAACA